MGMHPSLLHQLSAIGDLCKAFGVSRLEVFGSAARSQDFDPGRSDADFLVEFKSGDRLSPLTQFFGLSESLEQLLGRPVDLIEVGAVKNPYLRAGINRARELVYAA